MPQMALPENKLQESFLRLLQKKIPDEPGFLQSMNLIQDLFFIFSLRLRSCRSRSSVASAMEASKLPWLASE